MLGIEGKIDFHSSSPNEGADEDLRAGLWEELIEGGVFATHIARLNRDTFERFNTYVLNRNSISPLVSTKDYLSPEDIATSEALLTKFEALDSKNTDELKRLGAQMEAMLLPHR